MKRVLFRCDASAHLGSGHIMRCLTLADAMQEQGWKAEFACTSESLKTVSLLAESGHVIHQSILPEAFEHYDVVTLDHYEIAIDEEREWRKHGNILFVIDDYIHRPHDCDLLLNQNAGPNERDYKPRVPAQCKLLLGPTFSLLRSQFAKHRIDALARRRKNAGEVQSILISLGSTDPSNLSSRIVKSFMQNNLPAVIHVVTTTANPYLSELKSFTDAVSKKGQRVQLSTDVRDMARCMAEADLAIGAGGSTCWERCCVGLPTILFEIADNQRAIISALVAEDAALDGGHERNFSGDVLVDQLRALMAQSQQVTTLSENASKLCDGLGAKRVAQALEELL